MSATIDVPTDWLESITDLKFPRSTDKRLQYLMDRNNEGLLIQEEKEELEALVEMSEELSLVRADAFRMLGRSPV
jgi:hypothetical protein